MFKKETNELWNGTWWINNFVNGIAKKYNSIINSAFKHWIEGLISKFYFLFYFEFMNLINQFIIAWL